MDNDDDFDNLIVFKKKGKKDKATKPTTSKTSVDEIISSHAFDVAGVGHASDVSVPITTTGISIKQTKTVAITKPAKKKALLSFADREDEEDEEEQNGLSSSTFRKPPTKPSLRALNQHISEEIEETSAQLHHNELRAQARVLAKAKAKNQMRLQLDQQLDERYVETSIIPGEPTPTRGVEEGFSPKLTSVSTKAPKSAFENELEALYGVSAFCIDEGDMVASTSTTITGDPVVLSLGELHVGGIDDTTAIPAVAKESMSDVMSAISSSTNLLSTIERRRKTGAAEASTEASGIHIPSEEEVREKLYLRQQKRSEMLLSSQVISSDEEASDKIGSRKGGNDVTSPFRGLRFSTRDRKHGGEKEHAHENTFHFGKKDKKYRYDADASDEEADGVESGLDNDGESKISHQQYLRLRGKSTRNEGGIRDAIPLTGLGETSLYEEYDGTISDLDNESEDDKTVQISHSGRNGSDKSRKSTTKGTKTDVKSHTKHVSMQNKVPNREFNLEAELYGLHVHDFSNERNQENVPSQEWKTYGTIPSTSTTSTAMFSLSSLSAEDAIASAPSSLLSEAYDSYKTRLLAARQARSSLSTSVSANTTRTLNQARTARFDPFYGMERPLENTVSDVPSSSLSTRIEMRLEALSQSGSSAALQFRLKSTMDDMKDIEHSLSQLSIVSIAAEQEWKLAQRIQAQLGVFLECLGDQVPLLLRLERASALLRAQRRQSLTAAKEQRVSELYEEVFHRRLGEVPSDDSEDEELFGIYGSNSQSTTLAVAATRKRKLDSFGRDIGLMRRQERRARLIRRVARKVELRGGNRAENASGDTSVSNRIVSPAILEKAAFYHGLYTQRLLRAQKFSGNGKPGKSLAEAKEEARKSLPIWPVTYLSASGYESDDEESISGKSEQHCVLLPSSAVSETEDDAGTQNSSSSVSTNLVLCSSEGKRIPKLPSNFSFCLEPMASLHLSQTEKLDVVLSNAAQLFADAPENVKTPGALLSAFREWRKTFPSSYRAANISAMLPRLLLPFVRSEVLSWNIFSPATDSLAGMSWYTQVFYHSEQTSESENESSTNSVGQDPEFWLLPQLVVEGVVPYLISVIRFSFFPPNASTGTGILGLYPSSFYNATTTDSVVEHKTPERHFKGESSLRRTIEDVILHLQSAPGAPLVLSESSTSTSTLTEISVTALGVQFDSAIEATLSTLLDRLEDMAFDLLDRMPNMLPSLRSLHGADFTSLGGVTSVGEKGQYSLPPSTHTLKAAETLDQIAYVGRVTVQALKLCQTLISFRFILAVSDNGKEDIRRQVKRGTPLPIHAHASTQKCVWFLLRKIVLPVLALYIAFAFTMKEEKAGGVEHRVSSLNGNDNDDNDDKTTYLNTVSLEKETEQLIHQFSQAIGSPHLSLTEEQEKYTPPELRVMMKPAISAAFLDVSDVISIQQARAISLQWVCSTLRFITHILPPDWVTIGPVVPKAGRSGAGGFPENSAPGPVVASPLTDLATRSKMIVNMIYRKSEGNIAGDISFDAKSHGPVRVPSDIHFLFQTLHSAIKSWDL